MKVVKIEINGPFTSTEPVSGLIYLYVFYSLAHIFQYHMISNDFKPTSVPCIVSLLYGYLV